MDPETQREINRAVKKLADEIEREAKGRRRLLDTLSVGLLLLTAGWTALGVMVVGPMVTRQREEVKQVFPVKEADGLKAVLVNEKVEKKVMQDEYEKARRLFDPGRP